VPLGLAMSQRWRLLPDHVDRLRFLLDAGLDPKETNFIGRSLLTEACKAGDPPRVQLLVARGADVDPPFDPERAKEMDCCSLTGRLQSSQIPLFAAAESGSAECVRLLLEAGASVHALDDRNRTALFHAGSAAVAELLLQSGIDHEGFTPIMAAADRGQLDCIRLLLAAGADPARVSKAGSSALTLAEQHLQDWTKINRSKKRSDIGSFGTPEEIEQRHKRALREAEECLSLLRQSEHPDASR